jgi:hypothetical protein
MKNGIHPSSYWICLIGLVGFLSGCHTPPAAPQDPTQGLPAKTQLKLVALAELKVPGKHADQNVGAYFLLVDPDEISFFDNYFKENLPRVVLSAGKDQNYPDLTRDDAGRAIDKLTGKPGVLLGFQRIEIKGDQAHVELVESESLSSITIHTFEMSLQKGKWTILIHSRRTVS